jgi:aspartyl protease family protein
MLRAGLAAARRRPEARLFGRVIFAATLCIAAALLGSYSLLERLPPPAPVAASPAPADASAPEKAAAEENAARPASSSYRETAIRADPRGQYAADALVNGAPVRMLVDTGASDVFVSASTAARLGLQVRATRKFIIQTANGRTTASAVRLDNVSLGGLYMKDVEALVLAPEAGEVNLLGESFLKRLLSVEQRDGTLVLRQ